MKKIMILNGSARTNGKTSALTRAFIEGAEQNGNEVREFFLTKMNIRECTGCDACVLGKVATCAQKDDMESIYEAYEWADVVVFASPLYWWHITGLLKMAVDRLYSTINRLGHVPLSLQCSPPYPYCRMNGKTAILMLVLQIKLAGISSSFFLKLH